MSIERVYLSVPKLLLPKPHYRDVWPVVACDQYTSQPEYWEKVSQIVGKKPSTLNLILPEVYLETPQESTLIAEKLVNMKSYLEGDIFVEKSSFVYLERKTSQVPLRRGLVVAIDLEAYSFEKGAMSVIRPTEQTVVERIPPRLKIRSKAPIESPHILILINDPKKSVIEPLSTSKAKMEKLYDQELMLGAGKITGYAVQGPYIISVIEALNRLLDEQSREERPFLYAVGDGNHSLATAKRNWENIKEQFSQKSDAAKKHLLHVHPGRYCLVELNNVYDDGIIFEPIHRVLFGTTKPLVVTLSAVYGAQGFQVQEYSNLEELQKRIYAGAQIKNNPVHHVGVIEGGKFYDVSLPSSLHYIPVGAIQQFLDSPNFKPTFSKIDYIHGDDVVLDLCKKPNTIGVYLPPLPKELLFPTVNKLGVLPRKTFSMGEADEKRFYFECRKIVQ